MHRVRTTFVALVIVAAGACSGSPGRPSSHGGSTSGPAPADLLTGAAGLARPIIVEDGVAYRFLEHRPHSVPDDVRALPACADIDNDSNGYRCWKTTGVADGEPAAAPETTLAVITPDGVCQAQVGPVARVNTSGCEVSYALAAPLTGCGAVMAPIGFAGTIDPALRWHPVSEVKPAAVAGDGATITDPLERRLVGEWLATAEFTAGKRHETRSTRVAVDAGAEQLTTILVAALVGDDPDECAWNAPQAAAVGIRRADELVRLDVPVVWDGAIAWGGHVVGVVSGAPDDVTLHAVGPDAKVTEVFAAETWSDNAECIQVSWAGVEYPCGL